MLLPDDEHLEANLAYKRREWRVQRVGWVLMLAVTLAAAAGLFGVGPISDATAGAEGSALHVRYDRFTRMKAPTALEVFVTAGPADEGEAAVWFDRDFLSRLRVQAIVPEPQDVSVSPDRVTYTFLVDADTAGVLQVTFHVKPEHFGRHGGRMGVPGGPEVELSQFVYP